MSNVYQAIGNLFNIEKGSLQSTKCTAGEYDFITAASDWKTHESFTHECEALVIAVAASGSLGRTHYVDGQFVASDLCFILTPKNEDKFPINMGFYHFVFNSLRPVLVAATKSGTSKEAINQKNFKKYKIPYFDIEQQDLGFGKLKNTLARKELIADELFLQKTLLKKLRLSILQEAIEGKLTKNWRENNSDIGTAESLLKRLNKYKKMLIEKGEIKKQRALPDIDSIKKPFSIPSSWQWCRVWDVAKVITSGSREWAQYYSNNGAIFVTMGNLSKDSYQLRLNNIRYVSPPKGSEGNRTRLQENDLLISITGEVGNLGRIPADFGEAYINQHTCLVRFLPECQNDYFPEILRSPLAKKQYDEPQRGVKNSFRLGDVGEMIIPLPPQEEQIEITKRIKQLYTICDQIEESISCSEVNIVDLMRAVLLEVSQENSASPLRECA